MPEPDEKQADAKEAAVQPKIEYFQQPGGIPSIYVNNVSMSPNSYDLRIYIGELMQTSPEEVKVLHKAEIIMSWVEAKIFANFIQRQVEAFEKKNGPIKFPAVPDAPERRDPFGEHSGGAELVHAESGPHATTTKLLPRN